jgi:hypothetical protein
LRKLQADATLLNQKKAKWRNLKMVKELLLIDTNVEEENESPKTLSSIKYDQDAQALWGINNFIEKVEANSMVLLSDIIKTDLKLAMEVSNVLTLLIAGSTSKQ